MRESTRMASNLPVAVPSCRECGIQSVARCPSCRRPLCLDHFPHEEYGLAPRSYAMRRCASPAMSVARPRCRNSGLPPVSRIILTHIPARAVAALSATSAIPGFASRVSNWRTTACARNATMSPGAIAGSARHSATWVGCRARCAGSSGGRHRRRGYAHLYRAIAPLGETA